MWLRVVDDNIWLIHWCALFPAMFKPRALPNLIQGNRTFHFGRLLMVISHFVPVAVPFSAITSGTNVWWRRSSLLSSQFSIQGLYPSEAAFEDRLLHSGATRLFPRFEGSFRSRPQMCRSLPVQPIPGFIVFHWQTVFQRRNGPNKQLKSPMIPRFFTTLAN